MHSTMQRIIGALRARVESRLLCFRNRFKSRFRNVRAIVFFFLSWLTSSRCNSDRMCGIEWLLVTAGGRRILVHLYLAVLSARRARNSERRCFFFSSTFLSHVPSQPRLDRESKDRFSLISPSPRNGSRYGKSVRVLDIGSNTRLYSTDINQI